MAQSESGTPFDGQGVSFWVKVTLITATTWLLLQIFRHIGDGILLGQAGGDVRLGASGPVGLDITFGLLPSLWVAFVRIMEACCAIAIVLVIILRVVVLALIPTGIAFMAKQPAPRDRPNGTFTDPTRSPPPRPVAPPPPPAPAAPAFSPAQLAMMEQFLAQNKAAADLAEAQAKTKAASVAPAPQAPAPAPKPVAPIPTNATASVTAQPISPQGSGS